MTRAPQPAATGTRSRGAGRRRVGPGPLATLALAGVLALGQPAGAAAQRVVGRTLDATTGRRVPAVQVTLFDTSGVRVSTFSDSLGRFVVEVPRPGTYGFRAWALGYDTVRIPGLELAEVERVEIEVRLGPRPLAVAAVEVVARAPLVPGPVEDFYRRVEKYGLVGPGTILDREALERDAGFSTDQVLARQPFVRRVGWGIRSSRILLKRGTAYCQPTYYLDGREVDPSLVTSLPVSSLEGLEIYRGFDAPGLFISSCGVVLAWSRRHALDAGRDDGRDSGPWRHIMGAIALVAVLLVAAR